MKNSEHSSENQQSRTFADYLYTIPIKRETFIQHLIEHQMLMIGKTFADAEQNPFWKKQFVMLPGQRHIFKKYALFIIQKIFRCNLTKAKNAFKWFDEGFGLREITPEQYQNAIVKKIREENPKEFWKNLDRNFRRLERMLAWKITGCRVHGIYPNTFKSLLPEDFERMYNVDFGD